MSIPTVRRGPNAAGIVRREPMIALLVLPGSGHRGREAVIASVRHAVEVPGLWTPVDVALHLKRGAAGVHRPLEISRASHPDHALTGAARFPHSHSASLAWL